MRRNLCVVSLLLLAAASAAGAWLLQPPSLRSVDLASVKGGNPPPCVYRERYDSCNDLHNVCASTSLENCFIAGQPPLGCQGCTDPVSINTLATDGFKTVYSRSTPVSYLCGHDKGQPICTPVDNECRCIGTPNPAMCSFVYWSIYDRNCSETY